VRALQVHLKNEMARESPGPHPEGTPARRTPDGVPGGARVGGEEEEDEEDRVQRERVQALQRALRERGEGAEGRSGGGGRSGAERVGWRQGLFPRRPSRAGGFSGPCSATEVQAPVTPAVHPPPAVGRLQRQGSPVPPPLSRSHRCTSQAPGAAPTLGAQGPGGTHDSSPAECLGMGSAGGAG